MQDSPSHGRGCAPPPFLIKTYEMVEDPATRHIVSWGAGGASFIVWNQPDFSRDLLPHYFKHNNFSSFIRQLNIYGFRKIGPERWEFANDDFIRGQMHLLNNIHRRKPVHSHSLQNQMNGPLAESERREFEDEINRLKYEKNVLLADLQRQVQQQCGIDWQMQSLEDRLVLMERRQKNIVASLFDILQRRGGAVSGSSLLETDNFSKKRRVPKIDFFVEEPTVEEQQRVPYLRTMVAETPGIFPAHPVNAETFDKMELSLVSLEKLFQRANSYSSSEDAYNPAAAAAAPGPALTLGEIQTAPMETNINLQPSASQHSSSSLIRGYFRSSPELAESPGYVQNSMLPLEGIHEDTHRVTTEVDMNSEISTTDTSQDETTTETGVSHELATVNDLFWKGFLTETPQSRQASAAESGRQDGDGKTEITEAKDGVRIGVDYNRFNHRDNVDQITEQMRHLASAERD